MKRSPMPPRKKPMNRGAGLARGGPIKPKPKAELSEKKKADLELFELGKKLIRQRSGGRCEYDLAGFDLEQFGSLRCESPATDAHHIERQSQGHNHRPSNLVDLCRIHHSWIHANVGASQRLGYLSPPKTGDL